MFSIICLKISKVKSGKKIDGFGEALKLLQALDLAKQQELLADIGRKDPEMAVRLKSQLVTFDDLKYLTAQMMNLLFPQIPMNDWGLAMRGCQLEVKNHLLSLLSKNNQQDLLDILQGKPRALSEVLEAQKKIMEVVLKLMGEGKIVYNQGFRR